MNKRQLLEYLLETNAGMSWQQILLALLVNLALGIWMYFVYRLTYRGTVYSKNFNQTLILLCVITTAVMLVISGNLALSLGMVGSLSIIRFRTAIKEPRDIAFLFWAICIGIACGSEFYLVAVLVSLILTVLLAVGSLDLYDQVSYLLVVRGTPSTLSLDRVEQAAKPFVRAQKLRMQSDTPEAREATLELRLRANKTEALLEAVRAVEGVESVNLVSYSGELLG
ncbi:MAG: DUF4956 domain-containing protein [Oscillospiraceae bacterium]|nr:DUF4956 domain-containing protein [Oscillospiraceae bacterium]